MPSGPIDDAVIGQAGQAFERRYAELYGEGTGFSAAGIQAITYRVRGTGVLPFSPRMPELAPADGSDPADARLGSRPVNLGDGAGFVDTAVYDYAGLRAGHVLDGPAVIEVSTTTVVVPAGRTGTVDRLGNLSIKPRQESSR